MGNRDTNSVVEVEYFRAIRIHVDLHLHLLASSSVREPRESSDASAVPCGSHRPVRIPDTDVHKQPYTCCSKRIGLHTCDTTCTLQLTDFNMLFRSTIKIQRHRSASSDFALGFSIQAHLSITLCGQSR